MTLVIFGIPRVSYVTFLNACTAGLSASFPYDEGFPATIWRPTPNGSGGGWYEFDPEQFNSKLNDIQFVFLLISLKLTILDKATLFKLKRTTYLLRCI